LLASDNVTLPALLAAESAMLPVECVLPSPPMQVALTRQSTGLLRRQTQMLAFGLTAWGLLIVLKVRAFVQRQVQFYWRRRSEAR
jgi:hypothetical protein